jgi:hypothetical protein
MVMSPVGLGTKNYGADEDQQQFTRPDKYLKGYKFCLLFETPMSAIYQITLWNYLMHQYHAGNMEELQDEGSICCTIKANPGDSNPSVRHSILHRYV